MDVVNHVDIDEWRRRLSWPVSTLKADILSITYDCYSQNNNVKMATVNVIIGDGLFLFSFAVIVNEQRIIGFLTENCFIYFYEVRCAHNQGDVVNFTTVACRISSWLK